MHHFAKFCIFIAFFTVALSASVDLDPRQMQVQYGVAYTDKDCSQGERRIYGLDNTIQVDPSAIVRGIRGLRPLTIYSDAKCTQHAKYYLTGHCAHYDNKIVTIMCAHMN